MQNKLNITEQLEYILHEEYNSNKLYIIALSITKDSYLAEDVVQDSFIKMKEKYHKLEDKEKLKPWLKKIVRNTAINVYIQQKKMRERLVFDYNLENEVCLKNSVEEIIDQKVNEEFANQLISKLEPQFRQVIILRYKKDLTLNEIAQDLNISLGTVKSRLNRSLFKLKKYL
ncbi:sigma-70 family RNA polymerase sigma factor [Sporosarcina limicola]|uniref:RNA polymerase sigma-70 factor (ECF subfamily) n=1 Tax=Sporosarcina limicola TaxID=34101 RepID=A0A927MN13_9BACL|nr:RNA polymerase sigma-70 factor (ECF subfamily) [Sporosarcina limicola]